MSPNAILKIFKDLQRQDHNDLNIWVEREDDSLQQFNFANKEISVLTKISILTKSLSGGGPGGFQSVLFQHFLVHALTVDPFY